MVQSLLDRFAAFCSSPTNYTIFHIVESQKIVCFFFHNFFWTFFSEKCQNFFLCFYSSKLKRVDVQAIGVGRCETRLYTCVCSRKGDFPRPPFVFLLFLFYRFGVVSVFFFPFPSRSISLLVSLCAFSFIFSWQQTVTVCLMSPKGPAFDILIHD